MSSRHPFAFFQGPIGSRSQLEVLLDKHLQEVWQDETSILPTGCLISDINAYLSYLILVLPVLAERLADGPHIEEYVNGQLDQMEADTDLSDWGPLDQSAKKLENLRFVHSLP